MYAPAITNFRRSGVVVPTPSVRSGPTEDLFLVLDELSDSGTDAIRLRVIVRPMVAWIWAGGILMAVGSVLSLVPDRSIPTATAVGGRPPTGRRTLAMARRRRAGSTNPTGNWWATDGGLRVADGRSSQRTDRRRGRCRA